MNAIKAYTQFVPSLISVNIKVSVEATGTFLRRMVLRTPQPRPCGWSWPSTGLIGMIRLGLIVSWL